MEKSLTTFEDDRATAEFDLVTSLCLWLGNESLLGNVVRDNKQRLATKPNLKVPVSPSKFERLFSIVFTVSGFVVMGTF